MLLKEKATELGSAQKLATNYAFKLALASRY